MCTKMTKINFLISKIPTLQHFVETALDKSAKKILLHEPENIQVCAYFTVTFDFTAFISALGI